MDVGARARGEVQILRGLNPGEIVVNDGAFAVAVDGSGNAVVALALAGALGALQRQAAH